MMNICNDESWKEQTSTYFHHDQGSVNKSVSVLKQSLSLSLFWDSNLIVSCSR